MRVRVRAEVVEAVVGRVHAQVSAVAGLAKAEKWTWHRVWSRWRIETQGCGRGVQAWSVEAWGSGDSPFTAVTPLPPGRVSQRANDGK